MDVNLLKSVAGFLKDASNSPDGPIKHDTGGNLDHASRSYAEDDHTVDPPFARIGMKYVVIVVACVFPGKKQNFAEWKCRVCDKTNPEAHLIVDRWLLCNNPRRVFGHPEE